MAKARSERFNKSFKALGVLGAVLMLLTTLTFIAFLVLDLIGINPMMSDGPRHYTVEFRSEDKVVFMQSYRRGENITVPDDPKHSESEYYVYKFKGWDTNGDTIPDIIPKRAYAPLKARALYTEKQIKELPSSSSSDSSSSSSRGTR